MKNLKTLGIAGSLIAAALVGGTLISVASAAPSGPEAGVAVPADETGNGAAYCATWKTTFADQLGVSVGKLGPAAKAASIATVDAALAKGDLTAEQATKIKARISAADGNGCHLLGGMLRRIARHAVPGEKHDLLDAAAAALGITNEQLFAALRSGDSLKEIAADHKVSYDKVSGAVLAAAKTHLDAAVVAGKLTQARADSMLAHLKEALAAGSFPGPRRHDGPGPDGPEDRPAS